MDQATLKYFDDGEPGDWVIVHHSMSAATLKVTVGEFMGFRRSKFGNWYLSIRVGDKTFSILTCNVTTVVVKTPAGSL